MIKRVLILHGWGGNSQSNWFPWLKEELEKKGVKVYCPDLPNSESPNQQEWLDAIRKAVGKFDESLSIVGHSLGAVSILRILESLEENEKIDKAILVSGFARNLIGNDIASFFEDGFNWEKIRKKANKIIEINSDNDPYVPLEEGEKLKE